MERLLNEIRHSFKEDSDISGASTKRLPFLTAVLQETLHLYPPAPNSMRQAVPVGGARIAGRELPEETVVVISCYSAFRSEQDFMLPNEFKPER